MKQFLKISIVALAAMMLSILPSRAQQIIYPQPDGGGDLGGSPAQGIGFHGAADTPRRSGVAQAALNVTSGTGAVTFSAAPAAQAYASGTLTMGALPNAGDAVTLGTSSYTFQNTFSGTTNQVLIMNDVADTLENLIAAITYNNSNGQQAGVTYQLSGTVANTSARAALAPGGSGMIAFALSPGTGGNSIASTSSFSSGSNSWGGSTLSGGAAGDTVTIGSGTYTFAAWLNPSVSNLVLVSGSSGTASNLVAAINATSGLAGVAYSAPTVSSTFASASIGGSSNIVDLTALISGSAANADALAKSSSAISVSGTSMSGGAQFTDTNAESVLLNEIRAALVQKGLIKGSN